MNKLPSNRDIATRVRFVSYWRLLAFGLMVVFTLMVFFPKDQLLEDFAHEQQPSYLTLDYLEALQSAYPLDPTLRLNLASQQISLGLFNEAEGVLEPLLVKPQHDFYYWQATWYDYQIFRQHTYSLKPKSLKRQHLKRQLAQKLGRLVHAPLKLLQLIEMVQDALYLKQDKLAVTLYHRIIVLKTPRTTDENVQVAKLALAFGDYQISAQFYFNSQAMSLSRSMQRLYFLAAIRSLQAGSFMTEAVNQAAKHLGDLENDPIVLHFLTKVALAANQPAVAQDYIKRALKLKRKSV